MADGPGQEDCPGDGEMDRHVERPRGDERPEQHDWNDREQEVVPTLTADR